MSDSLWVLRAAETDTPRWQLGVGEWTCIAVTAVIGIVLLSLARCTDSSWRVRVFGGDGSFQWESLTKEHITHDTRGLGPRKLAALRLFFAFCGFGLDVAGFWDSLGRVHGTFTSFTGWSWNVLSLYFLLAACADSLGPSAHCFIWALFQVCFSIAMFVTFIVYFVLMPEAVLSYGWTAMVYIYYLDVPSFVMHHFNAIFMLVEAYHNRMSFVPSHALFGMVYGLVYVVFSWLNYLAFGIFWYFFLDWRNPITALCYLVLVAIMWCAFKVVGNLNVCLKKGVPPELLVGAPKEEMQELASPQGS